MEPAAVTDMHPVVIVLGDGGGIDGYPGKGGEFLHQEDHRQGVRSVRLRAEPGHHRAGPPGHAHQPVGRRAARAGAGLLDKGADFVTAPDLDGLVAAMNELTGGDPKLDATAIEWEIRARDADVTRRSAKTFRRPPSGWRARSWATALMRVGRPHALLDPAAGPLIAVRLHVLTRKTLGGLQTDLSSRVLSASGEPVQGLYAAGRRPVSAAAGCTATGRWRVRSSAAACSPAGSPGAPRRPRSSDRRPRLVGRGAEQQPQRPLGVGHPPGRSGDRRRLDLSGRPLRTGLAQPQGGADR